MQFDLIKEICQPTGFIKQLIKNNTWLTAGTILEDLSNCSNLWMVKLLTPIARTLSPTNFSIACSKYLSIWDDANGNMQACTYSISLSVRDGIKLEPAISILGCQFVTWDKCNGPNSFQCNIRVDLSATLSDIESGYLGQDASQPRTSASSKDQDNPFASLQAKFPMPWQHIQGDESCSRVWW